MKQVDNILQTLPIGYYAKRKVDLVLDPTTSTSYFDPMNDKVVVSYYQISEAIDSVDENDIEDDVRCLLYHEISHVILTPTFDVVPAWLNIFEDERIETLLSNFYMRVNFKRFVKKLNHFNGDAPKTADEYYYQIVRYRIGPKKFLDKVIELIEKYRDVKFTTDWYRDKWSYKQDINDFYNEVIDDFNNNQNQPNSDSNDNSSNDNNQDQNDNSKSNNTNDNNNESSDDKSDGETDNTNDNKTDDSDTEKTDDSNKSNSSTDSNDDQKDTIDDNSDDAIDSNSDPAHGNAPMSGKELDDVIKKTFNGYNDSNLKSKINQILLQISKNKNKNGSAINSYSGKFDVRSVTRDDCKYFVAQNRNGHVKQYSKMNLNLFIDTSGSFSPSEEKANQIIKALNDFEKANDNFSLNVVSVGRKTELLDKNKRAIKCYGGNRLDENLETIFKKIQKPGYENYNIVLFDGDCVSSTPSWLKSIEKERLKTFNRANVTIISDPENRIPITRYCKIPKVIFTTYLYVDELEANVLKTLQSLTR